MTMTVEAELKYWRSILNSIEETNDLDKARDYMGFKQENGDLSNEPASEYSNQAHNVGGGRS